MGHESLLVRFDHASIGAQVVEAVVDDSVAPLWEWAYSNEKHGNKKHKVVDVFFLLEMP